MVENTGNNPIENDIRNQFQQPGYNPCAENSEYVVKGIKKLVISPLYMINAIICTIIAVLVGILGFSSLVIPVICILTVVEVWLVRYAVLNENGFSIKALDWVKRTYNAKKVIAVIVLIITFITFIPFVFTTSSTSSYQSEVSDEIEITQKIEESESASAAVVMVCVELVIGYVAVLVGSVRFFAYIFMMIIICSFVISVLLVIHYHKMTRLIDGCIQFVKTGVAPEKIPVYPAVFSCIVGIYKLCALSLVHILLAILCAIPNLCLAVLLFKYISMANSCEGDMPLRGVQPDLKSNKYNYKWVCEYCNTANTPDAKICKNCHKYKD